MTLAHHRTQPTQCPACHGIFTGATNLTGSSVPSAGDYSMCIECLVYLVYVTATELRVLTNKEWAEVPLDLRRSLTRARDTMRAVKAAYPRPGALKAE